MPKTHAPLPTGARDPRLDFFRGLSLVMIYLNHVPGTIYEMLTSRNFGHSDAAEAFVFMSGVAAALAYGPKLKDGLNIPAFRKIWGRSWLLYMVHIVTAMLAIAIVATAAKWYGGEALLTRNAFKPLTQDPLAFLIGIATLGHQLGYVNILPMYAALLLAAPFLIRLGQRNPMGLLGFTIGFWVLTGMLRLNLPNYPFEGGWFFNPFAWQLLFSLGILTGLALRKGERFVPVKRGLIWPAVAWLGFCAIWVKSDYLMATLGHVSWQLRQWDVPFFLVDFDKTFVSGPRLLHILALAYVLSLPGIVPTIAASRVMTPVRLMGRHGLPVFAMGTVLAILAQAIKEVHPGGFVQDSVLILGGLGLQYGFARTREWLRSTDHAKAPTPVTRPVQDMPAAAPRLHAKPAR
ncbi:OpgC domain-containing protein [Sinirhodobacter sp. HNIBRBA609]|nr:OpgC domain-containing protein [Sinirhodobacter sp. HNIBRBA609]